MRKTVLIFKYVSLPENIKNTISGWCGFHNDCMIPMRSEFTPGCDFGDSWKESLTQEELEKYYRDQCEENRFKGSLEDFIKKHGLELEKYLIDQKIDLTGIDEILIDVSW